MKKLAIALIVTVFCISIPGRGSAGRTKANGIKPPPMSTEDDGYRADADPLPEWLFLPDGSDENSFSYSGTQSKTLTMKESGSDRWEIVTERNGQKISYTNYADNKFQFVIKTNKNYVKMTVYVKNSKGKLKKTKSFNPEDYFDTTKELSFNTPDPRQKVSIFGSLAAGYDKTGPSGTTNSAESRRANAKRVKAKLTKKQINKLNHKVGFKGRDASIANKVAYYESGGGNTQAVACENNTAQGFNPPYGGPRGVKYCKEKGALGAGRGLYQISSQFHGQCTSKCAFSPEKNAKYAYKLRKKGGWTQWCSYGGCGSNDPNPAGQGPAMTQ